MSFIEDQVCSRVKNTLKIPTVLVVAAAVGPVVTISAMVGTILAAATLDYSKNLRESVSNLRAISLFLPTITQSVIAILNPKERTTTDNCSENGFLSGKVIDILEETYIPDIRSRDRPTNRGILIGLVGPWLTAAKIVDLAVGIIATAFVILTLGFRNDLNQFAINQLKALDVVALPFALIFGLVSPNNYEMKDYFFPNLSTQI